MDKPGIDAIEKIINGLANGVCPGRSGIGALHLKYLITLPRFTELLVKLIS